MCILELEEHEEGRVVVDTPLQLPDFRPLVKLLHEPRRRRIGELGVDGEGGMEQARIRGVKRNHRRHAPVVLVLVHGTDLPVLERQLPPLERLRERLQLRPRVAGLLLGVAGVLGLLIGGLSTGFVLAVFMANAGGAWDNAKKYVEEGNFGGKGGDCHKATVVGDTVGDPFKDTSGPSLNILIKLMSMVSIVMAGLTVTYHLL